MTDSAARRAMAALRSACSLAAGADGGVVGGLLTGVPLLVGCGHGGSSAAGTPRTNRPQRQLAASSSSSTVHCWGSSGCEGVAPTSTIGAAPGSQEAGGSGSQRTQRA
jgi:hypothetical protein